MDSDEPAAVLISYLMQQHEVRTVALEDELRGLHLRDLRKRAKEAGIHSADMEEAMDSDEPAAVLISYLMQQHEVGAAAVNDVEAELDEDNEEDQEGEDMMKFVNPLLD